MSYERFLNWRTENLREEEGVIVGADLAQEWLLPWWWKHYQRQNVHQVAFIDFGLSFKMKEWCKQRGELISLRILSSFVKEREEMDLSLTRYLEEEFGKSFWECRNVWFKKPLGFLLTPFRKTIWIDLDCEVRSSIDPLFSYADAPEGLALAKDLCDSLIQYEYPIYNSGVVVFRRNIEQIRRWARGCLELNQNFRGDQEILSYLIAQNEIPMIEFPGQFNWSRCQNENEGAAILHWHGVYGKYVIRHQMNMDELNQVQEIDS